MHTSRPNDGNAREATLKEWRRPELCKLPIEATSGSTVKPGANNADGVSVSKPADSSGTLS